MIEPSDSDPAKTTPPASGASAESHPAEQPVRSKQATVRSFHGWRLLGVIFLVIFAIAVISAAVDWWVIGPLEGRAPWL